MRRNLSALAADYSSQASAVPAGEFHSNDFCLIVECLGSVAVSAVKYSPIVTAVDVTNGRQH